MTRSANRSARSRWNFVPGAIATSILTACTTIGTPVTPPVRAAELLDDNPKAVLDEAWQLVNREYVDASFNQTDWQAVRQRLLEQEYTSTEAAYDALRAELRRLDDPYTRFLNPQEFSEISDQTAGEVSGVGLQLQRDDQSRAIFISEVLEGSPAERDSCGVKKILRSR